MTEKDNGRSGMTNFTDATFYKSIIEQARDIILVVDTNGRVIYANQVAIAAYGYSIEELCTIRVHDLRAPETRATVDSQMKMVQQGDCLFRTMHMRRNGERFPVEVSSRCAVFPEGEVFVSIVRDITETVSLENTLRESVEKSQLLNAELAASHEELTASEEELRQKFEELLFDEEEIYRQNIILTLLHETGRGLMQRLYINDVLKMIITSATELLDTSHGYISLVDEEKGVFERKVALGYYEQDVGRQIKITEGSVGQIYQTGEITVIDDYSTWENRLSDPFYDPLHSVVQVPLKEGDKIIGVFGLAYLTPDKKFSTHEISLLNRFGELANIALVNAHLHSSLIASEKNLRENNNELMATHEELLASEEELRQQFEQLLTNEEEIRRQNIVLTSLNETALGLMHKLDPDDLLKMIVASATHLLGTPDGWISLVDEENGVFVRKVAVGRYIHDMARRASVTEGLIGQAYTTGQIAIVNDYSKWEQRSADAIFDEQHCMVQVPLKYGDKVIGVFGLAFYDPGRTLEDHEVSLLQRIADLASIALDNATLLAANKKEIQERKQTEQALRISEAKYRALINAIPDPMFIIKRDGTFVDYIAKQEQLYMAPDLFLGKKIFDIYPPEIATKTMNSIERAISEDEPQTFEYQMSIRGKIEEYEVRIVASGEDEVLAIGRDITERKRMQAQLEHLSLHDALTGLYNRAFFEEQTKHFHRDRNGAAGVLVCDVDGLKIVNDTLGHHMGDVILKAVAQILNNSFRAVDLVARIGGDEFAVLLPNNSVQQFEAHCRQIRKRIACYNAQNPTVPISLSMGFAVSSATPIDMNALFREADNNMYREKLHQHKSARSAMVQALIKALEARDFITEGHGDRLQDLIQAFASAVGLPESRISDLRLFAHFHDIGKVGIPDQILFKPGRLTEAEWTVMRQHCEIGYRIAMASPDLAPIADWILKHQEWWNGTGYPLGLKGETIPLECRMLAIVDTFDAMTNDRPYRKAMNKVEALAELHRYANLQFDPKLVAIFSDLVSEGA